MSMIKHVVLFFLMGAFLAACGGEGPMGSPAPKKPEWANQSPDLPFR
jgi:hypothetical protein